MSVPFVVCFVIWLGVCMNSMARVLISAPIHYNDGHSLGSGTPGEAEKTLEKNHPTALPATLPQNPPKTSKNLPNTLPATLPQTFQKPSPNPPMLSK